MTSKFFLRNTPSCMLSYIRIIICRIFQIIFIIHRTIQCGIYNKIKISKSIKRRLRLDRYYLTSNIDGITKRVPGFFVFGYCPFFLLPSDLHDDYYNRDTDDYHHDHHDHQSSYHTSYQSYPSVSSRERIGASYTMFCVKGIYSSTRLKTIEKRIGQLSNGFSSRWLNNGWSILSRR